MPASTNEQKPDSAALERHAEVPSNKRQRLDDAADVPNSAWLHKFDRDLAALALKAARDLKEQGWAVVEGVLSGYTPLPSFLALRSRQCDSLLCRPSS